VEAGGFYIVTPALANFHFRTRQSFVLAAGNSADATFTAVPDPFLTANPIDSAAYFIRQQIWTSLVESLTSGL